MTTDFRALCAELVQAFEDLRDSSHGVFGLHLNGDLAPWDELIEGGRFEDWLEVFARARAALAKPANAPAAVAERPSDEELRDLWSWAAGQDQGPWPTQYHCFARAVLARWGSCQGILDSSAPAPAGEVAELVAWLRETGDTIQPSHLAEHQRYKRAADLLQRLSPPQPVPVSEQWPGPEDCDEQGRCWIGCPEYDFPMGDTGRYGHADPEWSLELPPWWEEAGSASVWLPAHALPLPEVK